MNTVGKVNFTYDPLGRRLSKTLYTPKSYGWKLLDHEHYLYHDQNEIGAFNAKGTPKNLRVLGLGTSKNPTTIGIELEGRFFAPLLDIQANIRRLIDLRYKSIASSYEFTAFGEDIQKNAKEKIVNPWRFASKRLDPEFGLIYFGKRFYDPECARWLTTDPAGFIDSANLYQYVFNNPFRYIDHDGRFISEIAQIGDDEWLICPTCLDAWQYNDDKDALVRCPKCLKVLNNPRYKNEYPHL